MSMPERALAADAHADSLRRKLDAARRDLLDLGLRNSLINYRPLRARGVEVVDELPAHVFQILVRDGKSMSFLAAPVPVSQDINTPLPLPIDDDNPSAQPDPRQTDLRLQTAATPEQLQTRLLNTFYTARTVIEEQGANILFVALGMLTWAEADRAQELRRAPLVLVPVELERSNALDRFRVRYTGEDIGENLSIAAKLKAEFNITAPAFPDVEDLDVDRYFAEYRQAIAHQPGWRIDDRAVVLGFFSFGKFLMFRDLDAAAWPEAIQPTAHPILQGLLGDGLPQGAPQLGEDTFLDDVVQPNQTRQVVDADSSQSLAILDVNSGRNLVIQGPPGTGKSQTITNLIAEAIGAGKSVLFVAEKMAALDVVKRRLDHVGLGDACLELHSHKINKRGVLQELQRTLELGQPKVADLGARMALLEDNRALLNAYCAAVNTPIGASEVTPYRALGELIRFRSNPDGIAWPKLDISEIASWPALDYARREALIAQLQARLARMGVPAEHPFWGCRRGRLLPSEQFTLRDALSAAHQALDSLAGPSAAVAHILRIPAPVSQDDVRRLSQAAQRVLDAPAARGIAFTSSDWLACRDDIRSLLAAGSRLSELHQLHHASVTPEIWQADLLTVRQDLASYGLKWWKVFSGKYRAAKATLAKYCAGGLPDGPEAQLQLLDDVLEAGRQREVVQQHAALGAHLFGPHWQGPDSDWPHLSSWSEWIRAAHQDIAEQHLPSEVLAYLDASPDRESLASEAAVLERALADYEERLRGLLNLVDFDPARRFGPGEVVARRELAEISDMLSSWEQRFDDLDEMTDFNTSMMLCDKEGLGCLVDVAARWPQAGSQLVAAFRKERFGALLERALVERPALAQFSGTSHESVIDRFRELDRLVLEYNRSRLAEEHWRKLPNHDGGGQLAALRREFEKKSRHLPIRELMARAGNAIQAIKPVFMMSPLSIATFLPPGSVAFDLVIFDEASQVKPVDAFGALLRGKQAVVVGDSRQLPPTSFFDTLIQNDDPDEENTTSDIESILGLFSAQNAPQRMLRWHYRSRHESLIAVSNQEFYDGRLVVFPSPDAAREKAGLVYHHLADTSYDGGAARRGVTNHVATRKNKGEALAVAQAVMRHAAERPHLTLGVAAFSAAQTEAILAEIELLRRQNPVCEEFFAAHPHEPFFVKNLENVQGDERDVIFISIGYGRTADGYVSMNFGPLNGARGERRLNVLITRARIRCEVFTNLTADDLDLKRTSARGVAALKRYLKYAQSGILDLPEASGRESDSPFEDAVHQALIEAGYRVEKQIGSGGFFIDLAIVDPEKPGRYILGIECDGATYHSARSAQDRDRLRQQVLEGLGWRIHRIWSTDWFHNPTRELNRAVAAIEEALAARAPVEIVSAAPAGTTIERVEEAPELPASNGTTPYRLAKLVAATDGLELHEVPRARLAGWIMQVVEVESPVHQDDVARRVTEAAGFTRIGSRIRAAIDAAIAHAVQAGKIRQAGPFLWANDMTEPVVRDRSGLPGTGRSLRLIAPEEIELAIARVVGDAYGMALGEAPAAACRLLGFQRVTDDMRASMDEIIQQMIATGKLKLQGEHLTVSERQPAP